MIPGLQLAALLLWIATPYVTAAPQRVVSTSPAITEILFALGLGDHVVGVSSFCRYPEAALKLPKIGGFAEPNVEYILQLRPDLVIVQKNPIRLTERLQAAKLTVAEVSPDSMEGVHRSIRQIAAAAGVAGKGEELSASLRRKLEKIQAKTAALGKPKTVFIIGRTVGTLDGLFAAGGGSYLAELIDVAGGVNVFRDSGAAYPKVTAEELMARNPEVVIDMGDSTHTGVITEEHRVAVVKLWSKFAMLRAVKDKRVYAVADDRLVVAGPRMVEAALVLARILHPEVAW
ncbi:MAG: ABC transporter substrate-binding protein [Acidobacteria bacterium]|nr:ABC transporter substrate-binding protein [Acidobacteriota bacterium]